jgi:GNAT superfamily N-acetyltransferase
MVTGSIGAAKQVRRRDGCWHRADVNTLPPGMVARSLSLSDTQAVCQVLAAAELADLGSSTVDVDDVLGDWQRPSFDPATDSLGIFKGDMMIGCNEVYKGTRALGGVHPAHRNRGVGTALVVWAEGHARSKGAATLGFDMLERSTGPALLRRRGYQHHWTSWTLKLRPGDDITGDRTVPQGVTIRPMRPGEEQATFQIVEDSFNEWEGRQPSTYADWAAPTLLRPGFEPWHALVAAQGEEVLGACMLGVSGDLAWVRELAVRRDQRGRGLGRLLLIEAFDRGRAAGATEFELATDTRTGALGLYESVGMKIATTYLHFTLQLR